MKCLLLSFFVAGLAGTCFAQMQAPVIGNGTSTSKSIVGTVLSPDGSPVPDAAVLLKDTKTLQIRSFLAQNDGKYHFDGLSSDINYELRAEANGLFSDQKMVSVFDSHKVVTIDLKLKKAKK